MISFSYGIDLFNTGLCTDDTLQNRAYHNGPKSKTEYLRNQGPNDDTFFCTR